MSYSDMRWMNELENSSEILSRLAFALQAPEASVVHRMTAPLTRIAELLKKRAGMEESIARFELDMATNSICLNLYDLDTGEIKLQLTPEQVEAGLKDLEETEDNEIPLNCFFDQVET